jgi:KipI family sensor histidine kinase inhibitor
MKSEAYYPRILNAGDSCLVVEFGNDISTEINGRVLALKEAIERSPFGGYRETVPTYRSLAICFDAAQTDTESISRYLSKLIHDLQTKRGDVVKKRTILVPVLYGEEWGCDLEFVSAHTGLSIEEVIRRHTEREYYCYMLGFTPGFAYLGGMDETLATPRLKEPRQSVPAGAVGIAGSQTGFYSISSPGGWQIIGRTPVVMFDPQRDPPVFLDAGMWVRFHAVGPEEFSDIEASSAKGIYRPTIIEEETAVQ